MSEYVSIMSYDFDKFEETDIDGIQFLEQLRVLRVRESMECEEDKPMLDSYLCKCVFILAFSQFIFHVLTLWMLFFV